MGTSVKSIPPYIYTQRFICAYQMYNSTILCSTYQSQTTTKGLWCILKDHYTTRVQVLAICWWLESSSIWPPLTQPWSGQSSILWPRIIYSGAQTSPGGCLQGAPGHSQWCRSLPDLYKLASKGHVAAPDISAVISFRHVVLEAGF